MANKVGNVPLTQLNNIQKTDSSCLSVKVNKYVISLLLGIAALGCGAYLFIKAKELKLSFPEYAETCLMRGIAATIVGSIFVMMGLWGLRTISSAPPVEPSEKINKNRDKKELEMVMRDLKEAGMPKVAYGEVFLDLVVAGKINGVTQSGNDKGVNFRNITVDEILQELDLDKISVEDFIFLCRGLCLQAITFSEDDRIKDMIRQAEKDVKDVKVKEALNHCLNDCIIAYRHQLACTNDLKRIN